MHAPLHAAALHAALHVALHAAVCALCAGLLRLLVNDQQLATPCQPLPTANQPLAATTSHLPLASSSVLLLLLLSMVAWGSAMGSRGGCMVPRGWEQARG